MRSAAAYNTKASVTRLNRFRRGISHFVGRAVPRSIIGWFVVCWSSFLLASVVVGALLLSLYDQSTTEQLRRASAAVAHGCGAIAARYHFFTTGVARAPADLHDPDFTRGLTGVVQIALHDLYGVEGGIWQRDEGALAYAFPTYEGTGQKTDLPEAERPSIREAAEAAALDGAPYDRRREGRAQTLLLHACPLPGPIAGLSAWTMARVPTTGGQAYIQAMAGLGLLLFVVLGSAAWLGRLLLGWSRRLRRLESALATSNDELPKLELTGQQDLDRIVEAINLAGTRLADARRTSEALVRQMAEANRLATLGRVVAGIAHEIRNPIAAMRLKAENAVAAGPDLTRKDNALRVIVEQIGRLETLLRNLLSSVQRAPLVAVPIKDIAAFLTERVELFREQAASQEVELEARGGDAEARFDPARIAQAIDNLILNAIQNTPRGGRVTLSSERKGDRLVLSVADTGQGVPEAVRAHLFEPFVTGRSEGTGLGLAVVREIAEAHGGAVRAVHRNDGTTFVLELPWRPS
ncbi:HAMP domain-containing histidine kinase [Bradyrhizobium sp. 200]|uniref:sensor histidine kinase n=1 Tax=Bradyrhizobium sp. 200 TaxID=2782665 RepID=UPI001FFFE0A7|nr:HAMP domain-containing sensor histidine kinase [Bradyrhizobium sp. 200]UPJ50105.1 HAMP domain-containing histidine kinase [Bradyrhizobium sp. 200]